MAAFRVIQPGFEPGTDSLEGCCSIQLSYWTHCDCKITTILLIFALFAYILYLAGHLNNR